MCCVEVLMEATLEEGSIADLSTEVGRRGAHGPPQTALETDVNHIMEVIYSCREVEVCRHAVDKLHERCLSVSDCRCSLRSRA